MNRKQLANQYRGIAIFQNMSDQIFQARKSRSPMTICNIVLGMVICFQSLQSSAQDFQQKFEEFRVAKDTAGQRAVLQEWKKNDPQNPELYVAGFNFFIQKSMQEVLSLQKTRQGENVLQLLDTTGKTAAYLGSNIIFDDGLLERAMEYIDQGISAFPDRLDMRFGKIYILGQNGNYGDFTREIISTVDQSGANKNNWLWTGNKPVERPKEFMLSTVQEYVLQLYNTQDDSLLDNMAKIAGTVLQLYPDHVESLSDLSIVYLIRGENDKALPVLLKAEKIAPNDFIVLNNIAETYKRLGDYRNAIKYYKLVLNQGDEDAKKVAKAQIEALKKK